MEREYELLHDIVIPAGTKLSRAANQRGGHDAVEAPVAIGRDATGWLVIAVSMIPDAPELIE